MSKNSDGISEILFLAFEACGANDGVVYLSVPITTGLAEARLLSELNCTQEDLRTKFRSKWEQHVVRPNEAAAVEHARKVRRNHPGDLVIEPVLIRIPEWDQEAYNVFWRQLIERYAKELVLAPGWEFSQGCRKEVNAAIQRELRISDVERTELSLPDLRAKDTRAREALKALHWTDGAIDEYLPPLRAQG